MTYQHFQAYHGCPNCETDRNKVFKGQTMEQRYKKTMEREQFLINHGYEVTTMWDCEFKIKLRHNPLMAAFVIPLKNKLYRHRPLQPRNSLRGGRTNAARLMYVLKPHETISYKDFT